MADRNAPGILHLKSGELSLMNLQLMSVISNLPTSVNGNAVSDVVEAIAELEVRT